MNAVVVTVSVIVFATKEQSFAFKAIFFLLNSFIICSMTFDPFSGRFELTFIQSSDPAEITELFVPIFLHYGGDGLGYQFSHSEDLVVEGWSGQTLKVRKNEDADVYSFSFIRIEPTDDNGDNDDDLNTGGASTHSFILSLLLLPFVLVHNL